MDGADYACHALRNYGIRPAEWAAMGVCLCITVAIGGVIYAVYRSAVKVIKGQLGIIYVRK